MATGTKSSEWHTLKAHTGILFLLPPPPPPPPEMCLQTANTRKGAEHSLRFVHQGSSWARTKKKAISICQSSRGGRETHYTQQMTRKASQALTKNILKNCIHMWGDIGLSLPMTEHICSSPPAHKWGLARGSSLLCPAFPVWGKETKPIQQQQQQQKKPWHSTTTGFQGNKPAAGQNPSRSHKHSYVFGDREREEKRKKDILAERKRIPFSPLVAASGSPRRASLAREDEFSHRYIHI